MEIEFPLEAVSKEQKKKYLEGLVVGLKYQNEQERLELQVLLAEYSDDKAVLPDYPDHIIPMEDTVLRPAE